MVTGKDAIGEVQGLINNDQVFCLRQRVLVADINAGLTLLPQIPTRRYRLIDVNMIAIGGAASGATDVRILGTQAAASVALLVAAVAGLTQNTLLRAGATNATILAAGASFAANDAGTPVTIGKTGGTLAGATSIDVLLSYSIDPR